uniref:Helicase n=1 Tax=viral metagenome TaxID=1070528 RepID=A0A6C0HZZ3_9ZZZZ
MVFICDKPYESIEFNNYFELFNFPLSDFQKYAIEAIVKGHHALITAHTGSGKTLPAEFAIQHFKSQGKKIIYTSPIKALSNQKFYEFSKKYPGISFGLFTGDIKTNPNADVLIMTTEILMNYLYSYTEQKDEKSPELQFQIDIQNELACVIFDEVHYINDQDRGQVWEQTILMLPQHIQMVMLSATIDNPVRFAKWCEKGSTDGKEVYLASTDYRVVPLTHYLFMTTTEAPYKTIKDKTIQQEIRNTTNRLIPIRTANGQFLEKGYYEVKNMGTLFDKHQFFMKRKFVLNTLAGQLKRDEMLPAIAFVFSRKNVEVCAKEITTNLLEDDSKIPYIVRQECEQIIRKFSNFKEYLELPEYQELVALLEKGIGIHHSGMIPALREIVELMISKKYIKLLFATESFAIGLDCPIKTAIFTSLTKFDGHSPRFLFPHEYTQMAGRAGRRGIDTVGHVVHCNNIFEMPMLSEYQTILCGKPQKLTSKFHIHYSMILNLIRSGNAIGLNTFVGKSMIYNEIQSNMNGSQTQLAELEQSLLQKDEIILQMRTPLEECNKYITIQDDLPLYKNKKRKEAERDISNLKENYKWIIDDCQKIRERNSLNHQILQEKKQIEYLEHYIEIHIQNISSILETNGFINKDFDNLTPHGKIAANIHEIHPLIMTEILFKSQFFKDISTKQIVSFLSIFTQVNILEEFKISYPPSSDPLIKCLLLDVQSMIEKYETNEENFGLNTGIHYSEMIHYDIYEEIKEWFHSETEQQCKYFIQNKLQEKGISIGDFTKAVLKIICISKELIQVCEMMGEIDAVYKLNEIEPTLLKYVIISQSLYI